VAIALGASFIPVRKPGKLPCPVYSETFDLEYGSATIEIHQDAIVPGARVLVIDDVLATGGTVAAAAKLVRRLGAELVAVSVVMELGFLNGRQYLLNNDVAAVNSIVTVS
jgi:adenine phosphoribosyltransferase